MTAELLTVDQFREHVTTALGDDAVQRLLDACEADIQRHCGTLVLGEYDTHEDVTEWFTRSRTESVIYLRHPASAITSVTLFTTNSDLTDTETVLVEDDEFWFDGNKAIRRKDGYTWGNRVQVVYTPATTADRRRAVLIQLVKLEINADPGSGFEGAGSWQHTTQDYEQQRQHLLWSLCPPSVFA